MEGSLYEIFLKEAKWYRDTAYNFMPLSRAVFEYNTLATEQAILAFDVAIAFGQYKAAIKCADEFNLGLSKIQAASEIGTRRLENKLE